MTKAKKELEPRRGATRAKTEVAGGESEEPYSGPMQTLWGHNGRWEGQSPHRIWRMVSAPNGTQIAHACGIGMNHQIKEEDIVRGPLKQGRCHKYEDDADIIWTLDRKVKEPRA